MSHRVTVKRWTYDNAQRHVTAFRPISEAAHSWSYDDVKCLWSQFFIYDTLMLTIFTARCYASAVVATGLCPCLCVCLCLCLSVTSRCSTKTAKRRMTQTTPHDTPGTLVFWSQRSPRNSTGSPPTGAPNAGGVGQNRRLSTNNRLYLENGRR